MGHGAKSALLKSGQKMRIVFLLQYEENNTDLPYRKLQTIATAYIGCTLNEVLSKCSILLLHLLLLLQNPDRGGKFILVIL